MEVAFPSPEGICSISKTDFISTTFLLISYYPRVSEDLGVKSVELISKPHQKARYTQEQTQNIPFSCKVLPILVTLIQKTVTKSLNNNSNCSSKSY